MTSNAYDPNFPMRRSGAIYPRQYVMGVIDDLQEAERAVQAFREAGYAPAHVRLFYSEAIIAHAREIAQHRTPWQRLVRVWQLGTDEGADTRVCLEEALRGHHTLFVYAPTARQVEQVHSLMVTYHAHHIKHFGTWTITDFPAELTDRSSATNSDDAARRSASSRGMRFIGTETRRKV